MTKVSLTILKVLKDNEIESSSKALSVSQIISQIDEKHKKSYSTVYRHLCNMAEQGYVQCGLYDGLASTYYITESGKIFYNAQN
jgi:Fe2+ or Zn2+ uptake regulation protein